jgi:hypothetical protein
VGGIEATSTPTLDPFDPHYFTYFQFIALPCDIHSMAVARRRSRVSSR